MKRTSFYLYILMAFTLLASESSAQVKTTSNKNEGIKPEMKIQKNLTDEQLLDLVQKQTFRYFWDFGHPISGMARERSNIAYNYGNEVVTTGGTGFGVMAIIVAAERKFISREQAALRTQKIVDFLHKEADMYHGAFPHWLNGSTGKTIRFSLKDDGADIVETSFLFQGLLTAREYYIADNPVEKNIRSKISEMWNAIEWNWFTHNQDVLYWHWSPNHGWAMNHQIKGYNECLITYILAAGSQSYPIKSSAYYDGWTASKHFLNHKNYYNINLPLGMEFGGPLFFAHYSFTGLDPRGLKDQYADYWEQNKNHTLINRAYCIDNPKKYKGYNANSWGLTASDSWDGYSAHSPTNDLSVISPTAALSSFPYTPEYSMQALKHFYFDLGDQLWTEYGFADAFSEEKNWYAKSHLAIDQGPIIVMIENYRTGLLWNLFMKSTPAINGLMRLGFTSPALPELPTIKK
ncbi:MAG: glucoamylase family protein [Candidatus Pedobacter colombiensis]|uniref:Glucoamylase family protein n=1 Tax=Candidatus Pedobacter colombiensis TaxID=3121371 RepID=A0AAJ5W7Q1_9SPHI|nr:glucoamylase family protein [Pedobacter sp.]WEK18731.1 MAG: glucoamylase family protein [Pedobacter sp.]